MFVNSTNSAAGLGAGNGNFVMSGYAIATGALEVNGTLYIEGAVVANGSTGLTTGRNVSTPNGTRTMTFSRGILIGFT